MVSFWSVKSLKEFSSQESINMQKVFLYLLAIFTFNTRFVFQTKKQLTIKLVSKQARLTASKSVLVYYHPSLHDVYMN